MNWNDILIGAALGHIPTVLWAVLKVGVEWFAAKAETDGHQDAKDLFWERVRGIVSATNPFVRKP